MAKCVACQKSILMGGIQGPDGRYCSTACRFRDFFPKLQTALAGLAATNPDPLPAAIPTTPAPAADPTSPWDEDNSNGGQAGKALLVVLIGWGFLVGVAALIHFLVDLVNYPFHNQTFWFILPVGAFLCGMVGGFGFWLALRWLNILPNRWIVLAATIGATLSYVLIYFLMWWLMEFQGAFARDEVGFLEFLQYVLEHQRVRFGRGKGEGVEVGQWGYARFVINLAGFVAGVLATVAIGGGKTYCKTCRRYLKTVGSQERSTSDPDEAANALHPVIHGLLSGRIQEAVDLHRAAGQPGSKEFFGTKLAVEACPGCGEHLATLTATVPGEQGRQAVQGFAFSGKTPNTVRFGG